MKRATLTLVILFLAMGAKSVTPPKNSCVTCHSQLEGAQNQPSQLYPADIHNQAGLGCADCHGGDPSDESMGAMSRAKGFRRAPKKTEIPGFCARCHSDSVYMQRFNPKLRVDQLDQYLTSVHGKRLRQGDMKVAACVDCHGVHNIRAVSDTRASVHPTNAATTCARCHSDSEYMKGYKIPVDQFARYQKSVHAQMLAQGDTSAPTCNTCHGNHGATPPGVAAVAHVCGTCHVVFAQLFDKSPHQEAFAKLNLPGCVQCHSNHEIVKPSDDWVGVSPGSACTNCHADGDKGYTVAQKMAGDLAKLKTFLGRAEEILKTAERSGMEVSNAKVDLAGANENLVKARVNIHTFRAPDVQKLTDQGVQIAQKDYEAGVAALKERDFRRKGLGISLIAIVLALGGLYMKIRQIESRPQNPSNN